MTQKKLIIAASLLLAASLHAAEAIQFRSTPKGNKVRIEGTSTIHDWQVESSIIGGSAELGDGFPLKAGTEVQPGPVDAKVSVFIPVRQLKSIEKDGKPYSTSMDNIMYEKLLEADHKQITYKLTELKLKEAPKATDQPYQFEANGELCVAGVTNKITMPVMVTFPEEDKVKFAGSVTVKMTDFKVEPPAPSLALGLIKTGNEVKLFFEWVAVRKADAAK
jgi:polyisoprenoid-binding protein YceI